MLMLIKNLDLSLSGVRTGVFAACAVDDADEDISSVVINK